MAVFENNHDLLRAFREGEKDALTTVYNVYVEQVCAMVQHGFVISAPMTLRISGVSPGCERADLVQDIFVRAFAETTRYGYDGLRPFRPYLLRIARNLMIDRHRSANGKLLRSETSSDIGDIELVLAEDAPVTHATRAPDEQLHWEQLSSITRRFVETLDMESQRLVNYRFEQCLSQGVVALKMGLTRRRVRTLEASIQRGLRRRLQQSGIAEHSIAWLPAS